MRAIEHELVWHASRNPDNISGRKFLPGAALRFGDAPPDSVDVPTMQQFATELQQLVAPKTIRATMNIYTRAVPERLREANSKVVRLLLRTGT